MINMHADILRMAKTQEQRERIKWYHARTVFFSETTGALADGLALAKRCDNDDARFLVSLFPNGPPSTKAQAAAVFLAREEDPRCLSWAAQCGTEPRRELLHRSAKGGYAWGQKLCGQLHGIGGGSEDDVAWIERAAAAGEPSALSFLGTLAATGVMVPFEVARAYRMWQEAAQLGDCCAQFAVGKECCRKDSPEQYAWMRRSALQVALRETRGEALEWLLMAVRRQVKVYERCGSGRLLYEIGGALAPALHWREGLVPEVVVAGERAVKVYEQRCREARRAVLCWIWLARQLRVAKDVRLLVADMVWDRRAVWDDRKLAIR